MSDKIKPFVKFEPLRLTEASAESMRGDIVAALSRRDSPGYTEVIAKATEQIVGHLPKDLNEEELSGVAENLAEQLGYPALETSIQVVYLNPQEREVVAA